MAKPEVNILALDTCLGACSVAARRGGTMPIDTAERTLMATGHAEALMPMVERVLLAADLSARDIGRIVVTHGPGTFTGTRIGVAAARGLSLATGADIAVVSSLKALGLTVLRLCAGEALPIDRLLVVVAARNNEAYVQLLDAAGVEVSDPQVLPVEAVAKLAPDMRVAIAGSGASDVAAAASAAGRLFVPLPARFNSQSEPDAAALLDIAVALAPSERPSPLYLRPADAKPPASPALPMAAR